MPPRTQTEHVCVDFTTITNEQLHWFSFFKAGSGDKEQPVKSGSCAAPSSEVSYCLKPGYYWLRSALYFIPGKSTRRGTSVWHAWYPKLSCNIITECLCLFGWKLKKEIFFCDCSLMGQRLWRTPVLLLWLTALFLLKSKKLETKTSWNNHRKASKTNLHLCFVVNTEKYDVLSTGLIPLNYASQIDQFLQAWTSPRADPKTFWTDWTSRWDLLAMQPELSIGPLCCCTP